MKNTLVLLSIPVDADDEETQKKNVENEGRTHGRRREKKKERETTKEGASIFNLGKSLNFPEDLLGEIVLVMRNLSDEMKLL